MTKITRLEAQNVMRLTAVRITPDGSLVVVGGKNAQGKTSVLNSIAMAIGGKRLVPDEPLRKGAKKGHATVTLDNGMLITRTFTKGGGGSLVVSNKDGSVKSPQRLLDSLTGSLTFDPLEFSRMDPGRQLLALRALVGLDTSEIDKEEQELREKRTAFGRDKRGLEGQLAALPAAHEIKDPPINIAELAEKIEAADESQRKVDAGERYIEEQQKTIDMHEVEILELKERAEALEKTVATAKKELEENARVLAVAKQDLPDVAALRKTLAGAEEHNERIRQNATRAEAEAKMERLDAELFDINAAIEHRQEAREKMIAEAKFPVDGLSLGEDGVVYNGVPFDQASSAEQLRVSVAMGLAMNPELKVLLIRDGSLLDEDSLKLVAEMAEAGDAQVWMERVGDGDEVSVVIEDGHVREDPGPPVGFDPKNDDPRLAGKRSNKP